jgi:RNA recognition motif-containing protein
MSESKDSSILHTGCAGECRWHLRISGATFEVKNADHQNWFEANGFAVESAEVMTDRKTGRSRGIGFVALQQNDQLKDAIDRLNGQTF